MGTYRGRSSEDRQPQDEDEYTTTGLESEWYGHPGPATPSDRERMRKHHAIEDDGRPPFEAGHDGKTAIPPDRHLDDQATADYAYRTYGQREPGHARSDPQPVAPFDPAHERHGREDRD